MGSTTQSRMFESSSSSGSAIQPDSLTKELTAKKKKKNHSKAWLEKCLQQTASKFNTTCIYPKYWGKVFTNERIA